MNFSSLISSKTNRKIVAYFLLLLTVCCQVTETLHLNSDGSGSIEVVELRDENSYMQLVKEAYSKEDIYKDTTYVFSDYFQKYSETFNRTAPEDQAVYKHYSNVKVHSKKSSYDKEFRTVISQNFQKASEIVDLYKTEDYADNIKNNYALSAEEHYYKVRYDYDGHHFSRIVKITDSTHFKNQVDKIEQYKTYYKGDLIRKGKDTVIDYVFANEREWRYVPPITEDILPFVPIEKIQTSQQKSAFNQKLGHLRLNFQPDDIKYLIVEKDSDINNLINHLKHAKSRFSKETVDRLASRILTYEQIEKDV